MLGVGLLTGLRLPGSECEVLESLLGLDSLTLRAFLQGVDFPGLWAQGVACQSMMRGDGSWGGEGGDGVWVQLVGVPTTARGCCCVKLLKCGLYVNNTDNSRPAGTSALVECSI